MPFGGKGGPKRYGNLRDSETWLKASGGRTPLAYSSKPRTPSRYVTLIFFVALVWEVWNHRNKVTTENKKMVSGWACGVDRGVSWCYGKANLDPSSTAVERVCPAWSPLRPRVTMNSVDVAIGTKGGRFRTGCVLRDHRGFVIASEISVKHIGFSPPLAEAISILWGLILAAELGMDHIVVQPDCPEVVRAVRSRPILTTKLGTILNDIKAWLLDFSGIDIVLLSRSCNIVVHNFTRFALSIYSDVRWSGLVPLCAMREVLRDQKVML